MNNKFILKEYSEGELKSIFQKFKDEADDFNIDITDDALMSAIKTFDTQLSPLRDYNF